MWILVILPKYFIAPLLCMLVLTIFMAFPLENGEKYIV